MMPPNAKNNSLLTLPVSAFMGVAAASINVGGNALIVQVYGPRARPFMRTLHCAVGLGADGQCRIYSLAGTHFIVGLTGYFAP
jgi:hypothetical protein